MRKRMSHVGVSPVRVVAPQPEASALEHRVVAVVKRAEAMESGDPRRVRRLLDELASWEVRLASKCSAIEKRLAQEVRLAKRRLACAAGNRLVPDATLRLRRAVELHEAQRDIQKRARTPARST